MKLLLTTLFLLIGLVIGAQASHFYPATEVDSVAYVGEEKVKIPRSVRKKRAEKGLPASTPEQRFLQVFYERVVVPAATRIESTRQHELEIELLVDSTGELSTGDIFYLLPGETPQLSPPLFDQSINIIVFTTGGVEPSYPPKPDKNKPEWSKGQVALVKSLRKTFKVFPELVPARLNGRAVNSRWTLRVVYKKE